MKLKFKFIEYTLSFVCLTSIPTTTKAARNFYRSPILSREIKIERETIRKQGFIPRTEKTGNM